MRPGPSPTSSRLTLFNDDGEKVSFPFCIVSCVIVTDIHGSLRFSLEVLWLVKMLVR